MEIQREIRSKILSEVINDERIVGIINDAINHIEDYPLETALKSFVADIGDYQIQIAITNDELLKVIDKDGPTYAVIDNLKSNAEMLEQQIERGKAYIAGRNTMKDNLIAEIKALQAQRNSLK